MEKIENKSKGRKLTKEEKKAFDEAVKQVQKRKKSKTGKKADKSVKKEASNLKKLSGANSKARLDIWIDLDESTTKHLVSIREKSKKLLLDAKKLSDYLNETDGGIPESISDTLNSRLVSLTEKSQVERDKLSEEMINMFPVECRECEVSVFSRTYKQIFFASTQEMGERVYQMRENVLKLLEVMCDVAFHPDLKQPKQILTEMMGKMMDEFPEVKKTLLKMSKDAKKMVSEKISNEEFEEIVEDSVCSIMNSMQNKALKETADFFADKDRGEA